MLNVDLELLEYCRDPHCKEIELHKPHGRRSKSVRVAKGTVAPPTELDALPPPSPRASVEVGEGLIEVTLKHVGSYVPIAFNDLWHRVVHDYGSVTDRSVQRAVAALISDRRVASLSSSAWSVEHQRSFDSPGWYLRYDSPRLWQADGIQDLMSVVAELSTERSGRPLRRVERMKGPAGCSGGGYNVPSIVATMDAVDLL